MQEQPFEQYYYADKAVSNDIEPSTNQEIDEDVGEQQRDQGQNIQRQLESILFEEEEEEDNNVEERIDEISLASLDAPRNQLVMNNKSK